jgi:pimeloyl-ACP methyl ester carboxylesterase
MVGLDISGFALSSTGLIGRCPKGDGHRVIVLPGFCAGSHATAALRRALVTAGYDAVDWGLGTNLGPSDHVDQGLKDLILGQRETVTLVGWSLGGLYARALANQYPDKIRRVITLGSPHRADPSVSALAPLFRLLSPKKPEELTPEALDLVRRDPPVPLTSIYTRRDGVVDWKDCICSGENVEVTGTHMGLTHNLDVLQALLDRLPQS